MKKSNSSHELHFSNEQPTMGGKGRQPLAFGAGFCVYLNYEHDSRSLTLSNDYHQQFTFFEIDRAQRDTATSLRK